jgi:hypothetical protein
MTFETLALSYSSEPTLSLILKLTLLELLISPGKLIVVTVLAIPLYEK